MSAASNAAGNARVIDGRRVPRINATGPRGGTTTVNVKTGMVRKNVWLTYEENEALRLRSFRERISQSNIIRDALRKLLGLRLNIDVAV